METLVGGCREKSHESHRETRSTKQESKLQKTEIKNTIAKPQHALLRNPTSQLIAKPSLIDSRFYPVLELT
jgi:hypothetical protein